jgi:membrane dipeptidase
MESASTLTTAPPASEQFGVYDFGLSPDQEQRARRLHAESVIVDMLFQGPCGYRTYAGLDLPARSGDRTNDMLVIRDLPVHSALAGECDDFYDCWAGSGMTAGNRQATFGPPYDSWFSLNQAQFDLFPWLVKALVAADVRRAKAEGKIAGFVTTQDTEGIDRKLNAVQVAYDFGMRMVGLTYNMQNAVGGGCTERTDTGVSNLGAALISRMDELGMIVDTSHSGRQTTLDACELSERPVVASHTSAAGLYEVDRAKSDEELTALAETGGVIGIYAVPFFLAPGDGVTIEVMLDHVDYVARLVGWRHVGIGTDWPLQADTDTLENVFLPSTSETGFRPEHNLSVANLVGFDDYRDFPNITRGLVSRGYDDEQIRGILGENFLRVFESVCG